MVENISNIQPQRMPGEPQKPTFIDIHTLHQSLSSIGALQQVLVAAKNLEKKELSQSMAKEESEEAHEQEGLALHKKQKKRTLKASKSQRQKKKESVATTQAVEGVREESDIDEDHRGLGDEQPLPPSVEQAYEKLLKDLPSLINILLQHGDTKYKSLMQYYLKELGAMHHPPTADDIAQLNSLLPTLTQAALSLPSQFAQAFFTQEQSLIDGMKGLINSELQNLNPQLAQLSEELKELSKIVPLLEQAQSAATLLESGRITYAALVQMGKSILALEEEGKELPANSPFHSFIHDALATWGSLTSNNPQFPPGEILGYSLFLAEMEAYTSSGPGDQQHINQVWDFFNHFDTEGIPGLANALSFIHKHFPSPSMNPTDWSYDKKTGKVILNYNGLKELVSSGMAKAIANAAQLAESFTSEASSAVEKQLATQDQMNSVQELQHALSNDLQMLEQILQEISKFVPGGSSGGDYIKKALAPLIRKELEGFMQLIAILERFVPGINLSGISSEISGIMNRLPNITAGDLNQLNSILGQLNGYADRIPTNTFKSIYWGKELDVFNEIALIGKATNTNSSVIYNAMEDIEKILARMKGGSFTQADIEALGADLETLMENGQVLSYGSGDVVNSFIESLFSVMGSDFGNATGSEASLYNALLVTLQSTMIQQYISEAGSGATQKGLEDFISSFVGHLPPTGIPALQKMEFDLENLSLSVGPDALFQLVSIKDGHLVYDSAGLSRMMAQFLSGGLHPIGGTPGGWLTLLEELDEVASQYNPATNSSSLLNEVVEEVQKILDVCWAMLWRYDSLQDLFGRVMLGSYMPAQEAELQNYAKSLKFNNDIADMFQAILKILTHFTEAGSNFAGPPTDAKGRADMLKNIQEDQKEITQALAQIEADIALINRTNYGDDPTIALEKQTVIKKLNALAGNLTAAQNQLSKVGNELATGKTPSINDLAILLHGDQNAQPPAYQGGLESIVNLINTNEQDYASTSLTEEFMLQMIMTRVEQEWSITTSAMKTLHQIYMALAKAIYK